METPEESRDKDELVEVELSVQKGKAKERAFIPPNRLMVRGNSRPLTTNPAFTKFCITFWPIILAILLALGLGLGMGLRSHGSDEVTITTISPSPSPTPVPPP